MGSSTSSPSKPVLPSGAEQDRYAQHFGQSAEKLGNKVSQGIDQLKTAAQTQGSGAEQDRYAQHLSIDDKDYYKLKKTAENTGRESYDKLKKAGDESYEKLRKAGDEGYKKLRKAAEYQGQGAEQDLYATRFSPYEHNLDSQTVRSVAASIATKGPKAGFSGLGYDGQQRARLLAGYGAGAEQERLGAHFGLSRDAIVEAAQRLKDGAKDVLERR